MLGKRLVIGKRLLACLLVVALAVVIMGCAGQTASEKKGEQEQAQEQAKEQQQQPAQKVVIKYSHNYPSTFSHYKAAEKFKEYVEATSQGQIEVQLYPNAQLGTNREQVEGVQQGSIELVVQPTAFLTVFVPEMQVLDLPFMFKSVDQAWKILDGDVGMDLLGHLEGVGLKGLAYTGMGFKQITTGKNRAVRTPEDLKGLKMRIMQSPIIQAQYEAWGAVPVPTSLQELYNALQQGVVDGQENDIRTIYTQKFYEVQTNMTISNHAFLPSVMMVNKKWFEGLSKEHQDIIRKGARVAVELDRSLLVQDEAAALKSIADYGLKIVELSEDEREAFRKPILPIYDQIRQKIGSEIVDAFVKATQSE
ncbi:MAG TPA: TRAP transporter substrate-binding protein [Clostridia bacterium]|nr:TRAP transporter substrate-binding protein [Clostridia bacterium]